jgi:threonine dehydrogenase-like Zn-dependent dehydrogenase
MKALTYAGPNSIAYGDVPDPELPDERGALVRVTTAGICGSDLHIYGGHGFTPETGFCVGHEAVGEVLEVGEAVRRFKAGDRVLVPASIGCARCPACLAGRVEECESVSAPIDACYGLGGAWQGSQAELVAVPAADGNLVALPDAISDEAGIVLTDNGPTGWLAARRGRVGPGDTVAVIGLGPVGLMAVQSAFAMGAARVIGADPVDARRERAEQLGAEPADPDDPKGHIRRLTGGGADVALEAVGADATIALALSVVRRGGRVSVVGVSQNRAFPLDMELAQVRQLEFHIGLCSVQHELPALLRLTAAGRLRPEAVVSHRLPLSEGPRAYELFAGRDDGVAKVVLDPAR